MEKDNKNIEQTFLASWLSGGISDTELRTLVSDEDFLVYQSIKKAFDTVEKPSFDVKNSYALLKERLTQKESKVIQIIPNWVYMMAASFVLIFGVYQFFKGSIEQHTRYAQTKEISLNEGTRILLNAQSTLEYSKYQEQREIKLNGEAFFEVTKKGDFTVTTSQGKVHVLGTKFNVINRQHLFEVICYEGKVKVDYNQESIILLPGDAWRSIDGKIKKWETDASTAGWLKGETNFQSTPIAYVLENLENTFGVKIKTKNVDTNVEFTGSYPNNDLEKALKSICIPFHISYEIQENNLVYLSN